MLKWTYYVRRSFTFFSILLIYFCPKWREKKYIKQYSIFSCIYTLYISACEQWNIFVEIVNCKCIIDFRFRHTQYVFFTLFISKDENTTVSAFWRKLLNFFTVKCLNNKKKLSVYCHWINENSEWCAMCMCNKKLKIDNFQNESINENRIATIYYSRYDQWEVIRHHLHHLHHLRRFLMIFCRDSYLQQPICRMHNWMDWQWYFHWFSLSNKLTFEMLRMYVLL